MLKIPLIFSSVPAYTNHRHMHASRYGCCWCCNRCRLQENKEKEGRPSVR